MLSNTWQRSNKPERRNFFISFLSVDLVSGEGDDMTMMTIYEHHDSVIFSLLSSFRSLDGSTWSVHLVRWLAIDSMTSSAAKLARLSGRQKGIFREFILSGVIVYQQQVWMLPSPPRSLPERFDSRICSEVLWRAEYSAWWPRKHLPIRACSFWEWWPSRISSRWSRWIRSRPPARPIASRPDVPYPWVRQSPSPTCTSAPRRS